MGRQRALRGFNRLSRSDIHDELGELRGIARALGVIGYNLPGGGNLMISIISSSVLPRTLYPRRSRSSIMFSRDSTSGSLGLSSMPPACSSARRRRSDMSMPSSMPRLPGPFHDRQAGSDFKRHYGHQRTLPGMSLLGPSAILLPLQLDLTGQLEPGAFKQVGHRPEPAAPSK